MYFCYSGCYIDMYILTLLASRFLRSNIRMSFKNQVNPRHVHSGVFAGDGLNGLLPQNHMEFRLMS